MKDSPIELSVVIPLFNEEENVEPLIKLLKKFKQKLKAPVEFILVNDGSLDDTKKLLKQKTRGDTSFRVFHFRANLGKSATYNLGFQKSNGKYIATMDGDLQDDPHDILPMLELVKKKADFVTGWKHEGKSYIHKSLFSKLFNLFIRVNTGIKLHDINCPLKVFKRKCVSNIRLQGENFRFLPLLVSYLGFTVEEYKVQCLPRINGSTKFGLKRYFQAFFDFFTVVFLHRFKEKPMHFFGPIGVFTLLVGLCIDGALTINGLFFAEPRVIGHQAMLLLGIALIVIGIQIVLFGFLATLIFEKKKRDFEVFLD